MASGRDTLVGYLCRSLVRPESDEATDAALLDRFIADRDEVAFAALVDRHARLVFHVCRRVLTNVHDAEDAFQAAFLVLARKAAAVRPREALAAWLHGVAYRVALKARSTRARHAGVDEPIAAPLVDPHPTPPAELAARELLAAVDDEVQRLPMAYRLPVILCCLEGLSLEEAAQRLGWTLGSVKGRLERGRARLHERLIRRGLTLSAALAAVELAPGMGAAAVLFAPTVRSALAFAAGRTVGEGSSAQPAALAQKVLAGMSLARLKVPATLLLASCLFAAGFVASRVPDQPPTLSFPSDGKGSSAGSEAVIENELAALPDVAADEEPIVGDFWALPAEATRLIRVSGRVHDPAGQPFAGAKLYVGYMPRGCDAYPPTHRPVYPLRATSGADGRFSFAFTKADLDERYLDNSRLAVVAVADGFGPDWMEITETDGLSLKLVEDLPVEVRVLDANQNPVAGAKVVVREVSSGPEEGMKHFMQNGDRSSLNPCRGPLPGQPLQAVTGSDGRFRLTGVGRDRLAMLALEGPAVAPATLTVITRSAAELPLFVYAATAPRPIRGVVRDQATGQPVADVKIGFEMGGPTTLTDQDGRYELLVDSARSRLVVTAQPQRGEPYFSAAVNVPNKPLSEPLVADLELKSGIPLRGRVTDFDSGKPPKRGLVVYYPLFPNAHGAVLQKNTSYMPASSAPVRPDGSYSLPVLPGPGVVLAVVSPRDWYASATFDERELADLFGDGKEHSSGSSIYVSVCGRQDGRSVDHCHAVALIKPDEGAESLTLDLTVHAAHTLRGSVFGPDGQLLSGVRVGGLTATGNVETLASPSFTVEGLGLQRPRELTFHHKEKSLGKVVSIGGDRTEALDVQLEPCGVVIGRLVNKTGQPVPAVSIGFFPKAIMTGLEVPAQTDRDGRFRASLVGGQEYSVSSVRRPLRAVGNLKVESGQTKDLGDVPVN